MQWYVLTQMLNREIIGKADYQSQCLALFDIAKYLYEPVPRGLKAPDFKLHYRAKLTDLVQSPMTSDVRPLINQKLRNVLRNFKTVPTSSPLPTKLIGKKGEAYPYYVYIQQADFEATDYARSVFCKPAGLDENYQPAYEDLATGLRDFQEVKRLGGYGARALYLKEDIEWDYFVLAGPPFLWMARDYVVEALKAAHITGICYIPFTQGDDFVYDDIVKKAIRTCGV